MSTLSSFGDLQARLLYVRRALLLAFASFLAAPLALAQEQPAYEPHVVVVQFEPGVVIGEGVAKAGLQAFDRTAARYGVHMIKRVFPFLDHVQPTPETARNLAALRRTYYVRYSADDDPRRVATALASEPGVTYAEPVPVIRLLKSDVVAQPDDPLYSEQTYLRHIRLPEAWDIVKGEDGNPPVIIAIVDSGGDWRHEDLLANVWTNENEIPGNGIDDDNNGFIDDVHGVNLCNQDDDNDPYTPGGDPHGTHVAGAASAVTGNDAGLAGAAWNARLMHICAFYEGILYAAANGAGIINTSWYNQGAPGVRRSMEVQVLDLATDMGALVVAAAGNDGWNNDDFAYYPPAHPRVLTVGATERDSRRKAGFSNYGKGVDVFAPGVDIITTAPEGEYTHDIFGTSFAAPLVSGVAALVKTRYPDISPDALREQIRLSSDNMDAENPVLQGLLGRGYVNAEAALQTPVHPAIRVKRWSWTDADGDSQITSGEEVTITATIVNYLADARRLSVGLTAAESYPYIDITTAEQVVGHLASGNSTEVTFQFTVSPDAPINSRARFYTRIRDGAFVDEPDRFTFGINARLDVVHAALSALYVSTNGDNWHYNFGWDITAVPSLSQLSQWHGISVQEGLIDRLSLSGNNLTGILPAELGNLSGLRHLYLGDNSLTGEIPNELGSLSQLQGLWLSSNSLTGTIPSELGRLSKLTELFLYDNSLTGEIPSELGNLSQLQELWLWGNSLSGTIPSELGNLSSLRLLYLHSNSLTGEIPSTLGNLSQLQELDLSGNSFTGRLPRSLMQLGNLQRLHFHSPDLCAPADDAFQAWLASIPSTSGPTCSGIHPPLGAEDETLPQALTLHGNYPNPFRYSTRLVMDLPWHARVTVEVMDVVGRRVLTVPSVDLVAGWQRGIDLSGDALPSGLYLYRVRVSSPKGSVVHVGRFVRIR